VFTKLTFDPVHPGKDLLRRYTPATVPSADEQDRSQWSLSQYSFRTGSTLEANPIMGSIAERALFTRSATAKRYRRFSRQVPLFAIGIFQNDVALDTQWTVRANRYSYCFF